MHRPVLLYLHRLGDAGGAEKMLCTLANSLSQRNFPVHIVTWDAADVQASYPISPRVIWHRLGISSGVWDKIRRTYELVRLLRSYRIRTLVGFVMSSDKTVYAAAKLVGVKLIVAERNGPSMYYHRYGRIQRWLNFIMLHLADKIGVQFSAFVEHYPASLRRRIVVIPNPVMPVSMYAHPSEPSIDGRFTILTVSRCDNFQKQLDCLVCAFGAVATEFPNWDLRIVGNGSDRKSLESLVEQRGLAGRVRFEGTLNNLSEVYAEAHLFAIPSLWEGFPNALAEAFSHGLPAVGFNQTDGVANLIDDGVNGWLVDGERCYLAFSCVLRVAMADAVSRAKYGLAGIHGMRQYAPEQQFDRWAELIDSVADVPP